MSSYSVLTIGNFDGIHLGHRRLLHRLQQIAKSEHLQSVVLSYTDHPAFTLKAHVMPKMLCPAALKKRELLALGIDTVELLNFTPEFAHTPALKFLREYIIPVWQPKVIVMGYDSHFGHLRAGNFAMLRKHSTEFGYQVEYIEPLLHEGKVISSSMIRELLSTGDIKQANLLLGKPYRLLGVVGHGTSKGRSFGFPTANLVLSHSHQLIPRSGIYLSKASLDRCDFFGLTNIGISPTVKHTGIVEIETYLLDFSANIYNQPMELELLHYLREEMMFNSVEELISAMQADLATARKLLQEEQL